MRIVALVAMLAVATAAIAQDDPKPSFDCSKGRGADERAICADPRLAEMDQADAIAFGQVGKNEKKGAASELADFLAARRACGGDGLCIIDQQVAALETYDSEGGKVPVPPWVGAYRLEKVNAGRRLTAGLPVRVAQCTRTKISAIGDRFGQVLKRPASDTDDTGSGVSFADGGSQVSYSFVPELARSAIGDDVLVCLVSIPQDCPKGDDRGKIYSTTDIRTGGSWQMPDSEHGCGGA